MKKIDPDKPITCEAAEDGEPKCEVVKIEKGK